MSSTLTTPRTYNPDSEYDGYYCIKVDPVTCGCGKLMNYVETDSKHIIIVWEEIDDDNLLSNAAELKRVGFNPKVVDYTSALGRCIEFYEAVEKGLVTGG
jgi:hypothetical protein